MNLNTTPESKPEPLSIEEDNWESYIGTKQIEAMPCTAAGAAEILCREVCTDNANDNGDGYLVRYKDGYISWSPAKAFEEAYRKTCGLTFGMAIEAMKSGLKISRHGESGYYCLHDLDFYQSELMSPALLFISDSGAAHIWSPLVTDILDTDWYVVGGRD